MSLGSLDPALSDMAPQLAQLRVDFPNLMTADRLQIWIDEGESHSTPSADDHKNDENLHDSRVRGAL